MNQYKVSEELGKKIHQKIKRWEKKQAMKKTIKAWAVVNTHGKILFHTVAETRKWSMVHLTTATWKTWYQLGFRIRRITITVED